MGVGNSMTDINRPIRKQRPPLHHRRLLPFLALVLAALAAPLRSAADDLQQVYVFFPEGVSQSGTETTKADDKTKYVTINAASVVNPSANLFQSFKAEDFHL